MISGRLLCCCGLGVQDWSSTLYINAWNNRALSLWSESWCSRICTWFTSWPGVSDIYAVQPCKWLVPWRRLFFHCILNWNANLIYLIGNVFAVCWWSLPSNWKKWTECSPNGCSLLHSQVKWICFFYFSPPPN